MKMNCMKAHCFLVAIFCVGLTGCGTTPSYEPLENGYGMLIYYNKSTLGEESTTRIELQYQDYNGKKKIVWPFIEDVMVNNDTAVFMGDLHSETGFNGKHIFACQSAGTVVDITAQVLEVVAKERGEYFLKASPTAGVSTLKKEDQWVEIGVASTDWKINVKLNWNQVSDIMREVKEKGVVRKDRVWGTSYIEKAFKPDEQK
jgi:hypothetical protein